MALCAQLIQIVYLIVYMKDILKEHIYFDQSITFSKMVNM